MTHTLMFTTLLHLMFVFYFFHQYPYVTYMQKYPCFATQQTLDLQSYNDNVRIVLMY